MEMASSPTNLHFVLVPLMAPGHMIPMMDIARILAHRGATVTLLTTPVNANRFRPVIARALEAKLKIQVVELQLQLAEVGLPQGCESFDMLKSFDLLVNLFNAMDLLEEPAENILRGLSPAPSCIISDNLFTWTMDVARRFNIPRLVFHGPGCFPFLCIHVVANTDVLDRIKSDSEYFVLPGLPDRVEFTKLQASGWGSGDLDIFRRMREAEKASYGIVVNSFQELEPEYAEELAKAKDTKVWCIGPVSLCNKSNLDIADRGNKAVINEHDCLKWLDSRESGSVIYVCLGSMLSPWTEQAIELGLGLELTNRPFIWCVRHIRDELERWFADGFEERVKDRGLIIHGWAPQVLILSHRAVGGFLTHCGWNSTLEGVCAGLPMITWPHFADQFLNEKFIVQVLKTGVSIGVEVPVLAFGEQDEAEVLVKKEDVKTAVERLMDEEEEGKGRRTRAREFGNLAKGAMEEGGSSHRNITSMMQDITEQLVKNMKPNQDIV